MTAPQPLRAERIKAARTVFGDGRIGNGQPAGLMPPSGRNISGQGAGPQNPGISGLGNVEIVSVEAGQVQQSSLAVRTVAVIHTVRNIQVFSSRKCACDAVGRIIIPWKYPEHGGVYIRWCVD